jgi:hypothetical protein
MCCCCIYRLLLQAILTSNMPNHLSSAPQFYTLYTLSLIMHNHLSSRPTNNTLYVVNSIHLYYIFIVFCIYPYIVFFALHNGTHSPFLFYPINTCQYYTYNYLQINIAILFDFAILQCILYLCSKQQTYIIESLNYAKY